VVDATRTRARPGRQLAPAFLRANTGGAFRILGVDPIPGFDIDVAPPINSEEARQHRVTLTVTPEAEEGPYGAMLRIKTDAPDQPVIEIPVYAFVQPGLTISPDPIVLVANDTAAGTRRRIQLSTYPGELLKITGAACSVPGVSVTPYLESDRPKKNVRFVLVSLDDPTDAAGASGTVTIETNRPGYERVQIPVTVRAGS